jgi:hypothetical protein
MKALTRAVTMSLIVAGSLMGPSASADPEIEPCTTSRLADVTTDCERSAEEVSGIMATSGSAGYEYRLHMQCKDNVDADLCDNPRVCATNAGEAGIWFKLLRIDIEDPPTDAAWEYYGDVCLRPRDLDRFGIITPGRVWERMKELDWPTAELVIQPPDGRTLVNFRTNFYTSLTEEPQIKTVRMFQIPVEIEATPVSYSWHWGDDTDPETTDWPGAPVPENVSSDDLDALITHEYVDAEVTVAPSVDVTYRGRYRIEGVGWIDIEQTLTLPGEAVDLEVIEARVHLVG